MAAPVISFGAEQVKRALFERVAVAASEDIATNIARFLEFANVVQGETWIELQALKVPSGRADFEITRFAHARDLKIIASLLDQADRWQPSAPGIYVIANQIDPAATTRVGAREQWHQAKKGASTTDRDIAARNVLFVDVDAERIQGTSASDAEKARARLVAEKLIARLTRDLPSRSIGLGDSGNGYGVFVALDAVANDSTSENLVRGILAALDVLYSDDGAKIDRAVSDAKRLVPAFGTMKRKGAPGIEERPHRRTSFACGTTIERVVIENLSMLLDSLYAELDAAGRAEVDKATGKKAQAAALSPVPAGADVFTHARGVDVRSVAEWLSLVDSDGELRCPGCGSSDSGVAFVGNGFKCSHDRCAGRGVPGRPGFRTTIDLVMEVRGVEMIDAVNLLAERYNFEGVRKAARQASPASTGATRPLPVDTGAPPFEPEAYFDAESGTQETVPPAADASTESGPPDPLETLRGLGALVGYAELCAATATPPVSIWFDGVLEDSLIEISGPSGHGKSTLSSLLLAARANPTQRPVSLLGRAVVPAPADRLLVSVQEENGLYSWRLRCEAACQALNLPVPETLARVVFLVRKNMLAGDAKWNAIRTLAAAKRVGGVFVDSRARVLAGDSNDEREQAQIAASCFEMIGTAGAPMVIVSHSRKGKDGATADDIEDIAGSQQRAASTDVVVLVTATKDDAGKVEHSTAKFAKLRNAVSPDHPAPVTFRLALDMDGRWQLDNSAPQTVSRDPRPLPERVKELLGDNPTGLTKNRMREVLRVSGDSMEKAITSLFSTRAITSAETFARGGTHKVFMLRDAVTEYRRGDD